MPWLRYVLYFISIAFVSWALAQMELSSPGSLRLNVMPGEGEALGASEFSQLEIIQSIVLFTCGVLFGWVARYCGSQRPLSILFGGAALIFLIRELDYFLDRFVIHNLWQAVVVVVGSLVIAYAARHRKRMQIALARIWPSPGLTLLFSGAVIMFAFAPFVSHEPLWASILGDDDRRAVTLAVGEFLELAACCLWMIGTIEYVFQARAIAMAEPQPAARRRRQKRKRDAQGRF